VELERVVILLVKMFLAMGAPTAEGFEEQEEYYSSSDTESCDCEDEE